MAHLRSPQYFVERHSLFVQANHVMGEYHAGSILLSNQTPFDLWEPMILHALYHALTLVKTLLLCCGEEDFRGWMYEFRLPPKACQHLGIRPGSLDQVITFWKALFSIRLLKLCDHLQTIQPARWTIVNTGSGVDLQDLALFMRDKNQWWSKLRSWELLVQSAKCKLHPS